MTYYKLIIINIDDFYSEIIHEQNCNEKTKLDEVAKEYLNSKTIKCFYFLMDSEIKVLN